MNILWLLDNPCCENSYYRDYIVASLPRLEKLDNQAISPEERSLAVSKFNNRQAPPREAPRNEPERDLRNYQESEPTRIDTGAQRREYEDQEREAQRREHEANELQKRKLEAQEAQRREHEAQQHEIEAQRREMEIKRREMDHQRRALEAQKREVEESNYYKENTPVSEEPAKEILYRRDSKPGDKHENLLCAILALLKDLDRSELELIKRDIERKLATQM